MRATPEQTIDWRKTPELTLTPILSAALDAFYEHGYHGTPVRDIARRVGTTVPALYYHHENKQAILFALMDVGIDRSSGLARQAVEDAAGDPEVAFFNLIEALVRFMSKTGKLAYLDSEIRSLEPENRARYAAKRAVVEEMMLTTIQEGVAVGAFEVTTPQITARALLGMIQAIAIWFRPDGPLSVDDVVSHYVDIAGQTVGARSAVRTRARKRLRA